MKFKRRYKIIFLLSFLFLLAGLLNYFFFHPDILLFHSLGINRRSLSSGNRELSIFFLGYFSDIAWCISLCFIAFAMAELNYIKSSGKILLLLLPFVTEGLQYPGLIGGTFDWYDMLTYAITIFLFILLFPKLKTHIYEKK